MNSYIGLACVAANALIGTFAIYRWRQSEKNLWMTTACWHAETHRANAWESVCWRVRDQLETAQGINEAIERDLECWREVANEMQEELNTEMAYVAQLKRALADAGVEIPQ